VSAAQTLMTNTNPGGSGRTIFGIFRHGLRHSLAHFELDHPARGDHHGLPRSGVASLAGGRLMNLKNPEIPQFEPAGLYQGADHFVKGVLDHTLGLDSGDSATLRDPLGHVSFGIHDFSSCFPFRFHHSTYIIGNCKKKN